MLKETDLNWIDRQPLILFVIASLTLGLAPFVPEPHLVEKLRMLAAGELSKPIDIFDLVAVGAQFGSATPDPPTVDVNGDGKVDIIDIVLVAKNFQ